MPEYLSPGVYVEETSFRPKTIEGVSTSTGGFVGPTRTGPTSGEPRLLTSFADFRRIYGGLEDLNFEGQQSRTNYLAYAVRAFFEEGGQRCYVARVFAERNQAGSENNKDGRAMVDVDDLTLKARYPGATGDMRVIIRGISTGNVNRSDEELTGVRPGDTLLINPGEKTALDGNFGIGFFDYVFGDDGTPELVQPGASNSPFPVAKLEGEDKVYPFRVRVLVQQEQKRPSGGVEFGPEEQIGEYTLRPGSGAPLIDGLAHSEPSGDPVMTPLFMDPVEDSGSPVETGVEYAQAIFNPKNTQFTRPIEVPVRVPNGIGAQNAAKNYKIELKADGLDVQSEIRTQGTITPSSATLDSVKTSGGTTTVKVKSSSEPVQGSGTLVYLTVQMPDPGDVVLEIKGISYNGGNGSVSDHEISFPAVGPGEIHPFEHRLEGGNDGKEPVSYETNGSGGGPPDDPEGFDALEDLENVSIVAAPGYTAIGGKDSSSSESDRLNVQNQLITHCEDLQYRIAVLDTPWNYRVGEARDWRGNIDSTHAAMYYPWITIFDPLTRSELDVPASGHVAGLYARNDIENGVHKAPANMVVRSAVGFETRINKRQQDVLNPEGVNWFRFFEGRGNRLWGARMATSDNEYKYVNIRRYLAYLERSIDEGTQVFVFENNGEDLWRNVRRTIGSFLQNEWRSNRLMGTTPEEAFFVRCDRSTMTQNDIDNGRLICEIGVALFRPAEFVIFRIGQKLLSDTG